jgi:hypothetical protein
MKAQLPCRGVPRADTKITVGFGPQAAALKAGIVGCITLCAVYLRCGRSVWREGQALPVNRTMPGKRVLPTVACEFAGDYAEGLGRYPTGFLVRRQAEKQRGQVQAV